MTETQTVGNGHSTTFSSGQKPTLEELERAKEILKAARKPSPKRKPGALPRLSAQGDRVKAEYHGSIDKNPVDWEAVENSQEFCLTPDGAGRMIKLDRRSAIDPATRRRVSAGYGQVFLLYLPSEPSKPF